MFVEKSSPIFGEFTNGGNLSTKVTAGYPQNLRQVLLSAGSPVTTSIDLLMPVTPGMINKYMETRTVIIDKTIFAVF